MLEQKSSRPDDPDGSTRLSQGERVADLAPRIRLRSRLQAAEAEKPPTRLSVVQLPIDQIKTYNNPLLEHPPAQIEALTGNLRKLDFLAPLIVDKDFVLINGHALLEAARHASFKTVPVVILDHLTPLEVKTARIALNKLTDGRIWNKKALRIDMIEIEPLLIETGVGFEIVGFSSAESDLIISSRDAPIEDAPHLEPSKVAVTRAGEIWVMGPHRLLCGNALDPEVFCRLMVTLKARMCFCDPPFNIAVDGMISGLGKVRHREFAMAVGEMSRAEFTAFLTDYMTNCAAHTVDGAVHYACMDWRHVLELVTAGEAVFDKMLNLVVWNKTNAGMGSTYRSQHELIGVFRSGKASHKNNFGLGGSGRYRTNVWTVAGANSFRRGRNEDLADHPTVKPTILVMDAIRDVSDRGEIVLDCFCGSGTTILAAEKTGRRGFGIELDPLYVDVAVRRWQKLTGLAAVLEDDGRSFDEIAIARAGMGDTAKGEALPFDTTMGVGND